MFGSASMKNLLTEQVPVPGWILVMIAVVLIGYLALAVYRLWRLEVRPKQRAARAGRGGRR